MATSALSAHGTLVQYGDAASPEKFTTLAEVVTIDPPEQAAPEIDVTSHDSVANEYILSSCEDSGEFSIEANYIGDATDTAVLGKLAGAATNWQLCFPNWGAGPKTGTFTTTFATDIVNVATHGLTTGQPVRVTTSGADLPAPLAIGTTYYVIYVAAGTFKLATTNALAVAGTEITITDDGTGTHTLQVGTRLSMAALVKTHKLNTDRTDKIGVNIGVRVTDALTIT